MWGARSRAARSRGGRGGGKDLLEHVQRCEGGVGARPLLQGGGRRGAAEDARVRGQVLHQLRGHLHSVRGPAGACAPPRPALAPPAAPPLHRKPLPAAAVLNWSEKKLVLFGEIGWAPSCTPLPMQTFARRGHCCVCVWGGVWGGGGGGAAASTPAARSLTCHVLELRGVQKHVQHLHRIPDAVRSGIRSAPHGGARIGPSRASRCAGHMRCGAGRPRGRTRGRACWRRRP